MPWCKLIPNNEPATAIWYWGASSQKYFKAVNARGYYWISSRMINVVPGCISTSAVAERARIMREVSKLKNIWSRLSCFSQFIYATDWYSVTPKCCSNQVFPTWRAPFNISGFRSRLAFHFIKSLINNLFMPFLHFFWRSTGANLHFFWRSTTHNQHFFGRILELLATLMIIVMKSKQSINSIKMTDIYDNSNIFAKMHYK